MSISIGVIQSAPTDGRTVADRCALMSACGIRGVEVCTGARGAADPVDLAAYLADWDQATAAHGMEISSLNCSLLPDRREDVALIFRAAAERGLQIVKVDVSPYDVRDPYEPLLARAREHWAALVPLAREYGVRAVAEVHPKIVCHSPSAMRRMLEGLDPQWIGAIYDPGNMVFEGWEDPWEAVDILGPFLAHLHVKNLGWQRTPEGKWECPCVALTEGQVDWPEVCRQLARVGYEGWGILEFLRPEMDNAEWITRDVQTLQEAIEGAWG
ncbi:MAG TPA: sugar phosphate isomerase/epimerase family protein [Armatimonadota bacterium]|jgi:sugar phosphate isomerase/epimerase